jgi:hypothetical protein
MLTVPNSPQERSRQPSFGERARRTSTSSLRSPSRSSFLCAHRRSLVVTLPSLQRCMSMGFLFSKVAYAWKSEEDTMSSRIILGRRCPLHNATQPTSYSLAQEQATNPPLLATTSARQSPALSPSSTQPSVNNSAFSTRTRSTPHSISAQNRPAPSADVSAPRSARSLPRRRRRDSATSPRGDSLCAPLRLW